MRQKGSAAVAAPKTTTKTQRKGRRMASYLCGIDIGGTFTDCVIVDGEGAVTTAKAPSTPHDFAQGVQDALEAAGAKLGLGLDALCAEIDMLSHGTTVADPLWRMPLWQGYKPHLASTIADISSTGSAPNGGAITAALFLEHFVEPDIPWAHIDLMAFNTSSRPGRPEGGEAQGIRGVYAMLRKRFA